MGMNTASTGADKKPTQDAKDIGADQGTDPQSMSSVGDKNISTNEQGGGDGSFPGDEPNSFIDPREVEGYNPETGEISDEVKDEDKPTTKTL